MMGRRHDRRAWLIVFAGAGGTIGGASGGGAPPEETNRLRWGAGVVNWSGDALEWSD